MVGRDNSNDSLKDDESHGNSVENFNTITQKMDTLEVEQSGKYVQRDNSLDFDVLHDGKSHDDQVIQPSVPIASQYPGQEQQYDQRYDQTPMFPTEKTFKFANDCAISIANTPSGFSTIMVYIKDTPFFGIGTIFSMTALEVTDATIYYNSKQDFLLDEDIDRNSTSPLNLDKERRMHKISIYKTSETNEYRIDFVKLAKTGIPEIDAKDPWKDYSDMIDNGSGNKQIELVKQFTDMLKKSRNEPDLVVVSPVPESCPELQPCVGIVMFKRVQ